MTSKAAGKASEKATENMVIGLTYTLKDSAGNLIEERTSKDPLLYIQGSDQIIPHIEEAVKGKSVGFEAQIEVKPEDYYGDYDDGLVAEVDRKEFPEHVPLEVGSQFEVEGPDGEPIVAHVIEIDEESVTLDGNHPLAGVELCFNIRLESIRPATPEEIEHGHVHTGKEHLH